MRSNLVKCYVERIVQDPHELLMRKQPVRSSRETDGTTAMDYSCPDCLTVFARDALIHGRPALKMVGGKVRMRKK